ncbi:MAG: TorF family putative porin [Burkholderiales bacterium]|nr:TorF family putative porin [Burkholderiales bacterium]MDE2275114.1 TorF family putative porin [Burkholderiales bacterium]
MKRNTIPLLAALAGLAALPLAARADDTPAAAGAAPAPAAAPASSLAYNIGVVSDYRYRGLSQSRKQPALQGGIDYTDASGAYVGTWLSTIKWIKDAGTAAGGIDTGSTPAEWDLYGGYRGSLSEGLSFDVGGLYYLYVNNKYGRLGAAAANANTFEIYGALTYGPATLKYSHTLTNIFGFADSKNSGYLDLSANFDLGSGFSLTPHIGHQSIAHNGAYSYTDFSLTLGKDFGNGFSVSAAAIGTDNKKVGGIDAYYYQNADGSGFKSLQKATLVVGAKYTF